jgi:glutathione peroxidase-family protein
MNIYHNNPLVILEPETKEEITEICTRFYGCTRATFRSGRIEINVEDDKELHNKIMSEYQ